MQNQPKPSQPIPPNAKRVFKGVVFDVYQWPQELYNGKTEIFEGLRRSYSVTVIPVTADGQIIISREEQPGHAPFVGVSGGQIDAGETPETAARRELLEETGYEAGKLELWQTWQPSTRMDWTIYTYIAKDCRKVREPQPDAGEKIELELVSFEQFLDLAEDRPWRNHEVTMEVLRAKVHPEKMAELKKLLFK